MELIFPRSTFSRLTPPGALGAGLLLAGLVGVLGGFDAAPGLAVFSPALEFFSFLSSAIKNKVTVKRQVFKLGIPTGQRLRPGGRSWLHCCRHQPSAAATSASSSDMSMSSVSLLSMGPSPSSMALPSSSGSTWALLGPSTRKGESEPVGEGASSEGEGMGESSGPGRVDFRESSFLLRLATRLAKAL